MISKKEIIEDLVDQIYSAGKYTEDHDTTSWHLQEGVILTINEAKAILQLITGQPYEQTEKEVRG